MNINQIKQSEKNKKSQKSYNVKFKKRIVGYYRMGVYDEQTIEKKFKINRTLLWKWNKWYYNHFLADYYSKPNYGKGKKPPRRESEIKAGNGSTQEVPQKRADEEPWNGNSARDRRNGLPAKKKWKQGVDALRKEYPESSIQELCNVFGKSRQAYYKNHQKEMMEEFYADLIQEEVLRIRQYMPRIGSKKLYHMMKSFLVKNNIKKGRDAFISVLRERDLMVKKKRYKKKTTNSNHPFKKYSNLTFNLVPTKANQLWVSDITYIRFGRTFYYLSIITDAYSRKIVGWYLSEDLKAEGSIKALKMALQTLPENHTGLIHHSDRGIQYCSKAYIKTLLKKKIRISMTQNGDPYENILAERINRTIKEEFLDEFVFLNYEEAKRITKMSVKTYNNLRPHSSVDYLTPNEAHERSGELKKKWKNPIFKKTA